MRVIIAGSRTIRDRAVVEAAIAASGFDITEVVSGNAIGVDILGEQWAALHGIRVKTFPADWKRYGKGAGALRNTEMSEYAAALVAVRQGGSASRGTTDMILKARLKGLEVFVWEVEDDPLSVQAQSAKRSSDNNELLDPASTLNRSAAQSLEAPTPVPAYTVLPEGRCFRLTLPDGRTGLFSRERDARDDVARLAVVETRNTWGIVRGYVNKEKQ